MKWLLACFAVMAVVLGGCGQRSAGATVTGTVFFDGKPAPAGMRIDFQPQQSGGSGSTGVTDAAGRYELWFNANLRGAIPGEHVVAISVKQTIGPDGVPSVPEPLRGVRIPKTVGEESTLTRTVNPGANTIDIEIDSSRRNGPARP
jgi:hypothetical protein